MRRFSLNKIYFFTLFLGFMIAFSGCESENIEYPINPELEKRIAEISKADLPMGITPLKLNNKGDIYALIEKLDKIELNASFASETPALPRVKTRGESNVNLPGIKDVDAQLAQGYDIVIHLAYEEKGRGPINVTSDNSTTWVFSSWTQTAGVANWRSANSINYAITGIIKWYILIQTDLFEVSRRDTSVSGDEPVS